MGKQGLVIRTLLKATQLQNDRFLIESYMFGPKALIFFFSFSISSCFSELKTNLRSKVNRTPSVFSLSGIYDKGDWRKYLQGLHKCQNFVGRIVRSRKSCCLSPSLEV